MSVVLTILAALALLVLAGIFVVFRQVLIDLAADRRRARGAEADDKPNLAAAAGSACLSVFLFALSPTLLFILVYELAPVPEGDRIVVASAALAAVVAILVLVRVAKPLPKGPTFPWRNLLIIAFAGLTVALHDDLFVKLRPTITNLVAAGLAVASILGLGGRLGGMVDRNTIALDDAGWRKFAAAFAAMGIGAAGLNEYVWRTQTEVFWVYFQLWGPALYCVVLLLIGFMIVRKHAPAGQCPAKPRAERSEPSNDD